MKTHPRTPLSTAMRRSPLRLFAVLALAACLVAVCVPAVHAGALPDLQAAVTGGAMAVQGASLAALPLFGVRPMLAPDGGDGGGGSAQTLTRDDVEAMLKGKFGADINPDMLRRLTELTVNLAKAEQDRDSFKTQLADAQKRVPEGAVVLTGDEAAAYNTLKAREGAGETPLKAAADALSTAATDAAELATLRASRSLADAVAAEAAAGQTLNQLALETYVKDLKVEIADHTADGKTTKRAFAVVEKDGQTTKVLLTDHLKAEHAALMPALTAAPQQADGQQATGGAASGQQAGGFVAQQSGGSGGGDGFDLDAYIKGRNEARSGAKPAATAAT